MAAPFERQIISGSRLQAVLALLVGIPIIVVCAQPLMSGFDYVGRPLGGLSYFLLAGIVFLSIAGAFVLAKSVVAPPYLVLTKDGFQLSTWKDIVRWRDVEELMVLYGRPAVLSRNWTYGRKGPGLASLAWRLKTVAQAQNDTPLARWHRNVAHGTDGTVAGLTLTPRRLLQVMNDWHVQFG